MHVTSWSSGSKGSGGKPEYRPEPGSADPGAAFDPTLVPDESEPDDTTRGEHRPAPAPGIPMSNEQYEWLKEKARVVRQPPSKHRQEDPSGKK